MHRFLFGVFLMRSSICLYINKSNGKHMRIYLITTANNKNNCSRNVVVISKQLDAFCWLNHETIESGWNVQEHIDFSLPPTNDKNVRNVVSGSF